MNYLVVRVYVSVQVCECKCGHVCVSKFYTASYMRFSHGYIHLWQLLQCARVPKSTIHLRV